MRLNKFRRIVFCGLVILIMAMVVTSAFPTVIAKGKPAPTPGKKYQHKTDLNNARGHLKDAFKKINHDLRLLSQGIRDDDIQKKLAARQSILDAVAILDEALEDYENAKTSAMNELTNDNGRLSRVIDAINKAIAKVKNLKGKCIQVIPFIDKIIQLEEEMGNLPDELRDQYKRLEWDIFKHIKSMI